MLLLNIIDRSSDRKDVFMLEVKNKTDFEEYTNGLLCGRIYLSDICQRDRLAYPDLYICAMRFYRYEKSILSPLETWKNDIETLPLGQTRDYLQLVWDGYDAEMRGLAYVSKEGNSEM